MLPLEIPSSNVVKNTAKTIMKRSPSSTVIICIFLFVTFFVTQILFTGMLELLFSENPLLRTIVSLIIFTTVFWPIFMGTIRHFWILTEQKEYDIETVFYFFSSFSRYKRAVKTVILIAMRVFLIGFICLLPCLISSLFEHSWIYTTFNSDVPLWSSNLQLITDFLKLTGITLTICISLRYYLVPVVAVMDDSLYLMETIHISQMISKHSLGAFASLILSFFGWFLLSLLGIPIVYVLPYFLISYVVHCRFAIVNYNLNLERVLR